MLALPLTPTSPPVLLDFDCAPMPATLSSKMIVPSYERPSSPSVFTTTTMTQSQPQAASQKRPKLSLQTSSLPITFGKSSTALTIAASTLPIASPTVLNTFNNAYDMPHRLSPVTNSPTGTRSARPTSRIVSPFASNKEDRPYQIPLGVKSILRNSPIPSGLRRSSLCPAGESPRTSRRALFPAAKKVAFPVVLEEEIQTTIYTVKHSDLSSDGEELDTDERSELSLSSSDESDMEELAEANTDGEATQLRKKRKAGSDRQIQAAAIRDCVANVERIQKRLKPTFKSQRKRRRRHWEWTLEPLKETSPKTEVTVGIDRSQLSPSQIPLPLSAGLDASDILLSPTKIPLPSSATFASSKEKNVSPLPSPAKVPLPPSATLPPPESLLMKNKAEEGDTIASAQPRTNDNNAGIHT